MPENKKSGDGGTQKGRFNIPYGSTEITKVPTPSPGGQRNIPYGSVVIPQPVALPPAASGPSGQGGSGTDSGTSGGGDVGGQTGGAA